MKHRKGTGISPSVFHTGKGFQLSRSPKAEVTAKSVERGARIDLVKVQSPVRFTRCDKAEGHELPRMTNRGIERLDSPEEFEVLGGWKSRKTSWITPLLSKTGLNG
jgi:hypothetical protein